ncbi:hypothetical protein QAD02_015314 [Eretmocerus hayati]|uniref:Uncharacterized protein n=1 Tax=Eretmocerus hayati TaxID=131215 RepID=A0ACC2PAQ2_9HYME|nr:hypothetical protein QAD02_015314 [Eretmocerus hayati]
MSSPALLMDVKNVQLLFNTKTPSTSLSNPKISSTLLVIGEQDCCNKSSSSKHVFRSLSALTRSLRHRVKPQCLVVLVHHGDIIFGRIEKILDYAWMNNFLDFTVVSVSSKATTDQAATDGCPAYISHYNPFKLVHRHECLYNSTELFPDKTNDMNGYLLRIPFLNVPPFMMRNTADTKEITGVTYSLIHFIAQRYNFKIEIVTENRMPNHTSNVQLKEDIHFLRALEMLDDGKLDLVPFQYFVEFLLTKQWNEIVIAENFNYDSIVVIVPIFYELSTARELKMLIVFIAGIIFIVFLIQFLNFARVNDRYSTTFSIIQILLSQPIKKQLRVIGERFIVLYFVIVSMSFLSNFYARLTELKLVKNEIFLHTFQDIDGSNLHIYVSNGLYELLEDNIGSSNLSSKSSVIDDIRECVDMILNGHRVICFTSEMRLTNLREEYSKSSTDNILRIVNIDHHHAAKVFAFRRNFLFVDGFEKSFQRIKESGLAKIWDSKRRRSKPVKHNHDESSSIIHIPITQILFWVAVGYLLSALVFGIEIAFHKIW